MKFNSIYCLKNLNISTGFDIDQFIVWVLIAAMGNICVHTYKVNRGSLCLLFICVEKARKTEAVGQRCMREWKEVVNWQNKKFGGIET